MYRFRFVFSFVTLALVFCAGALTALAGPISGGAGNWPYTKLGVYQGVISVAPTSSGVMEIGAAGKDIAASGQILIRPNSLADAQAATLVSFGGTTRLKIPGKVWLYPNGTSQPPVAYDQWPSGSSSKWNRNIVSTGSFGQTYPVLQTSTAGLGIRLGSASVPVTGGTALHLEQAVWGNETNALAVAHSSSAENAIQLQGDLISQDGFGYGFPLGVGGRILINGQEVFHPGDQYAIPPIPTHEGATSGLDADLVDGYNVTIENWNGTSCSGSTTVACLCFQFPAPAGKKCAALSNHM